MAPGLPRLQRRSLLLAHIGVRVHRPGKPKPPGNPPDNPDPPERPPVEEPPQPLRPPPPENPPPPMQSGDSERAQVGGKQFRGNVLICEATPWRNAMCAEMTMTRPSSS